MWPYWLFFWPNGYPCFVAVYLLDFVFLFRFYQIQFNYFGFLQADQFMKDGLCTHMHLKRFPGFSGLQKNTWLISLLIIVIYVLMYRYFHIMKCTYCVLVLLRIFSSPFFLSLSTIEVLHARWIFIRNKFSICTFICFAPQLIVKRLSYRYLGSL